MTFFDTCISILHLAPKRFTGDPCWQTPKLCGFSFQKRMSISKDFDTVVRTPSIPALTLKNHPKTPQRLCRYWLSTSPRSGKSEELFRTTGRNSRSRSLTSLPKSPRRGHPLYLSLHPTSRSDRRSTLPCWAQDLTRLRQGCPTLQGFRAIPFLEPVRTYSGDLQVESRDPPASLLSLNRRRYVIVIA